MTDRSGRPKGQPKSGLPLRSHCVQTLCDWEKGTVFAEALIDRLAGRHGLDDRDRGFLNEVVLGVLRNLILIDHRIARLRERGKLRPETRNILRVGLYQLFHMRVPDHAAVSETVTLAKTKSERGLVNAILRRAIREREDFETELPSLPLAIRYSVPEFLVERWTTRFGEKSTRELCAWMTLPPPVYLRINTLNTGALDAIASGDAEPFASDVRFLNVTSIPSQWIDQGFCYVQDPSTAAACDLLDPASGDTVLDACAAPGGKTSLLTAKMMNAGRILASDADQGRLERLRGNLERLGVTNTETVCIDWSKPLAAGVSATFPPDGFDAILVDAPCSNTGVMRRRVDVRWRLDEKSFTRMAENQLALLRGVVPRLRTGGKLVYSTCSIEPEENSGVVTRLLEEFPALNLVETRESLPFSDGIDGAYAALLQRP